MARDEAQMLANVAARAERLHEDGYRARWLDDYIVEVTSPQGANYEVDALFLTCTCPFYTGHDGRHACKHLLGYQRLLQRQSEEAARRRAAHRAEAAP